MGFVARLFAVPIFLVALTVPSVLYAASISFSPSSGSHGVGEEFSVRVSINPDGQSINAADATLSFDTTTLSVTSLSRDGSSFSLWTTDPTFSNTAGTISLSGGTPTAFSAPGTALTIKFRGKAAGTGKVSVTNGSILAADGKGTDVFVPGGEATFTIAAAQPKPTPAPAPAPDNVPIAASGSDVLVPPPDITSSTHKKPEQWYATTTAIFSWKVPPGMVSVRTLISQNKDEKPTKVYTPIISTQTFNDLSEGVWYFSAQFKDDFEWGGVAQYEARIDVTPPEEFDVAILDRGDGTPPTFTLAATDALSGVARYEIHLNGTVAATVRVEDLVDGAYPIPPQEGGSQQVTIKAFDAAGNIREVTKQLELPLVEKPTPKGEAETQTQGGFRFEWIVIVLFAFAIGGLVAWQMQTKKNVEREQAKILQRVIEIRERNDKVFAAMREEFEQIVNDFDDKPQLTAAERDLLEKLKEVLDLSEEVVDSDIEDLKKLVKNQ